MLNNLNNGLTNYIALGSFGIVKLQVYHGIYVAVKQFLPWTFSNDVIAEAKCHLLHLLGICTKELPYCIVMQFEEIQNNSYHLQPLTLHQELQKHGILDDMDWISVCVQSSEAVRYLHLDVEIISHNEVKPDNILLSNMHKKYNQSQTHH